MEYGMDTLLVWDVTLANAAAEEGAKQNIVRLI